MTILYSVKFNLANRIQGCRMVTINRIEQYFCTSCAFTCLIRQDIFLLVNSKIALLKSTCTPNEAGIGPYFQWWI